MYTTLRDRYGPPDGLAVPRCPLFERWHDCAAPTGPHGHHRPRPSRAKPARLHSVRHEHGSHGDGREHVAGHPAEEQ